MGSTFSKRRWRLNLTVPRVIAAPTRAIRLLSFKAVKIAVDFDYGAIPRRVQRGRCDAARRGAERRGADNRSPRPLTIADRGRVTDSIDVALSCTTRVSSISRPALSCCPAGDEFPSLDDRRTEKKKNANRHELNSRDFSILRSIGRDFLRYLRKKRESRDSRGASPVLVGV